MTLLERAMQIAIDAHKDQRRKTDDTPYVAHPLAVSRLLERYGFDEVTAAAAVVHDVLEDTHVDEATLRRELGDEVTDIVVVLTENKMLPWEERKQAYIDAVILGSEKVKAVSVGDKIHNLESLLDAYEREGASIWKKFNRAKKEKFWFEETLVQKLKHVWQHPLLEKYESLVTEMAKLEA